MTGGYPVPAAPTRGGSLHVEGVEGARVLPAVLPAASTYVGAHRRGRSVTSRLRLGTAVTNLVTRHPAVVASTFATLHHVSGGRAHIGVGRGDTALELVDRLRRSSSIGRLAGVPAAVDGGGRGARSGGCRRRG